VQSVCPLAEYTHAYKYPYLTYILTYMKEFCITHKNMHIHTYIHTYMTEFWLFWTQGTWGIIGGRISQNRCFSRSQYLWAKVKRKMSRSRYIKAGNKVPADGPGAWQAEQKHRHTESRKKPNTMPHPIFPLTADAPAQYYIGTTDSPWKQHWPRHIQWTFPLVWAKQ